MGGGGTTKRNEEQGNFYLQKGRGGRKSFSHAEEGAQKISFNMGASSFSHTEEGAHTVSTLYKWGRGAKVLFPVLRVGVGGCKTFLTRDFPIL